MRRAVPGVIGVALLGAALAGCGASAKVDNAAFVHDLDTNQSAEVTVQGTVTELLPDSTGPSGPHQDFEIEVAGKFVEVDHNLTLAPRVPLNIGDTVVVHGQFNPDPGNPNIDYTHHATGGHPGGWVTLRGHRYW